MSENETVNQSQSAAAGGSGDSPEKLVADHVDRLWEHIAADGYDLLADVAVESLTRNGDVPPDAYLRSVKMSWCLHRAATYYARQYSVERVSADFARGDAQFEHSLRAQAERKAEKLEADLAQSALLVENLRLRVDEARTKETESPAAKWCRKIRELQNSLHQRQQELTASFTANQELRQKLETAEAALLEQQQRNEELQQRNEELQRQVEGAKTQELEGRTQELPEKTQELQAEYTPPDGWRLLEVGEPLQNGDQWITESGAVEVLRDVKTEIVQPNGHYIRQIQPEVVQSVQVREGRWRTRAGDIRNVTPTPEGDGRKDRYPWWDAQCFHAWTSDGRYYFGEASPGDLVDYLGPIEQQPEPEPETTTEQLADASGRDIVRGLVLQVADLIEREKAEPQSQPETEAQPVQVREGRWRTRNGEIKNIRACEPLKGAYFVWPWTDGFMTFQDNGRHQGSKESPNDLVEYLGPIESQVEALTVNGGDDSGGN